LWGVMLDHFLNRKSKPIPSMLVVIPPSKNSFSGVTCGSGYVGGGGGTLRGVINPYQHTE